MYGPLQILQPLEAVLSAHESLYYVLLVRVLLRCLHAP